MGQSSHGADSGVAEHDVIGRCRAYLGCSVVLRRLAGFGILPARFNATRVPTKDASEADL